jgi:hypothetical protein
VSVVNENIMNQHVKIIKGQPIDLEGKGGICVACSNVKI